MRRTVITSMALWGVLLGSAGAETLTDALTQAYRQAPELQAARETFKSTVQNYPLARAGLLPSLTATGTIGKTRSETTGVTTATTGTGSTTVVTTGTRDLEPKTASLSLSQSIFRGGRTRAEMARAMAQIEGQVAQLQDTEAQVLLSAVAAYMNVLRDQEAYDIRQTNVATLSRQYDAANIRFEVGEITKTDVAQAEARLAAARAGLASAEAQLAASRAQYQSLMGTMPASLQAPLPVADLPADREAALAASLRENPTYLSAAAAERAAQKTISVARAAGLPTVDLDASLSTARDSIASGSEVDSTAITATLSIPLYRGGAARAAYRAALHDRNRARYALDQVARQVQEATTTAWTALLAARVAKNASRAQERAAEFAFEGVKQEAELGLRTTLDVLDAEQEYLEARLAAVSADRDLVVAEYQVLAAIGRLTAQDLGLPTETFNPDAVIKEAKSILIWP